MSGLIDVTTDNSQAIASTNASVASLGLSFLTYGFNADRDDKQAGLIAPSWNSGGGTLTLTANRAYAARFAPSRGMSITLISYVVTTAAGSNDNVDVGIYNGTTLAKVASSGSTASKLNSPGTVTVTLSASLTAGTIYYATIACGTIGSTGAALATAAAGSTNAARLFGNNNPQTYWFYMDTAFPLPATLSMTTLAASTPLLGVRES